MNKKEMSSILCMMFAVLLVLPAVSAGNIIVKDGELNITDDFLIKNSVFFVNSTNGRGGIGTGSPSGILNIKNEN